MSGSGGWDCGWVSNGETNLPTACYETIEGIQGVTMNRIVLAGLAVFAVVGSGVATRTLSGQAQATQAQAAEFQQNVLPVLAKSCLGCHNDKALAGKLSLEPLRDPATTATHTAIWQSVLEKVSAGAMPPPTAKPLTDAERAAVIGWIKTLPGLTAGTTTGEPMAGRVTARRLNRVEYNNTIRDLLGVAARPADEFPVDDSGYGFDNNGDVLSVSPMLMEKYMQAAEKISRLAVYGEAVPPKPTRLVRLMNRRSQDAYDVLSEGNSGMYLPYSLRGAMYGNFTFPVDGEYEFRLRIANFRGDDADITDEERARRAEERRKLFEARRLEREKAAAAGGPGAGTAAGAPARGGRAGGAPRREPTPEELKARDEAARKAAPPRKLILTVDGAQVISTVIEGTGSFGYSQGEFTERATVKAGERFIRASYPELANLDNPLQNINPDMRRGLFVDYLDIVGPFNPSTARPASYTKVFVCSQKTAQCARTILSTLMERAYRRPVTDDELKSKVDLVTLAQREGDSFDEGIRLALQAILSSPNFLFRIEANPRPRASAGSQEQDPAYVRNAPLLSVRRAGLALQTRQLEYPVSNIELASRLSYFLWASMPDVELMRVAKAGTLRQPAVLEAQVRRMMADPKGFNLVENWAAQWLQLRNLGRTKPDPKRFPTVDDELLDAMRTETMKFVETIIKEDRSLLDFIDAPFTWVNGPLARHYGIKGVDGEAFQRVTLDGEQRSGILTQGAILTVSSYPTRTSPPVRGKWVMENLLGTPPPPPPDDVPSLNDSNIGTEVSLRERLEQHRRDPSCSPCHMLMDPLGFGLENYDAVGAWRTHDGKFPIETAGTLPGGQSFTGSKGLKEILRAKSDAFVHNVSEKMLTYSLGRGMERFDRPTLEAISRQVKASDYRFSALVMEVVKSKPFQMQTVEGARP
jgi:mono/diheme cytochrome c family protein